MIDQVINSVPIDYRYYCCGLCNSYKFLSKEIIQQATKLKNDWYHIYANCILDPNVILYYIYIPLQNSDIYFQLGVNLFPRIICISQNRFASPLSTFVFRTLIKHKANLILECIMKFQYFKKRCPKTILVTSYDIVLMFYTLENDYNYVDLNKGNFIVYI